MTTDQTTHTLFLDPLDGLFFRDGRPFGAGNAATSGLPLPQTLAGALRSHLMARSGCDFAALGKALQGGADLKMALGNQRAELAAIADLRLSGPWLFRSDPGAEAHGVVFPVPAILHREKTGRDDGPLHLLRPLKDPPPGWEQTAAAPTGKPLWVKTAQPTEAVNEFLSGAGMADVLKGQVPDRASLVYAVNLYDTDRRVGLVIGTDTNAAADGQLYTAGFLCLARGVRFVARVAGLTPCLREALEDAPVLGWGGERRQARVSLEDADIPGWPTPPDPADADGTCLILTTPAPLANGWHGADWKPVAAAVPTPVAVSGWDLARRRPKPTRFAAPAGSVFLFDGPAPEALANGVCDGEDRRLGYGCVLKGVWRHA